MQTSLSEVQSHIFVALFRQWLDSTEEDRRMVVCCGDEVSLHLSTPDGLLGQYDVRSECGTPSCWLLGDGKMQGSARDAVELSVIAPVLLRGCALGGEVRLPYLGRGAEGEEGEEKEVEKRVTVAIHRQLCWLRASRAMVVNRRQGGRHGAYVLPVDVPRRASSVARRRCVCIVRWWRRSCDP